MIRESSGIGEVEVSGCLGPGADVPNGVNRQQISDVCLMWTAQYLFQIA